MLQPCHCKRTKTTSFRAKSSTIEVISHPHRSFNLLRVKFMSRSCQGQVRVCHGLNGGGKGGQNFRQFCARTHRLRDTSHFNIFR